MKNENKERLKEDLEGHGILDANERVSGEI